MQNLKILGIDPGTRLVGFGLLSCPKKDFLTVKDFKVVDAGVLKANTKLDPLQRLAALHSSLFELVEQWQPHLCVMESAFFGINAQSALKLGQARGALLTAVSRCQVPLAEIAPTRVKMLITGEGRADKRAVSLALQRLLGFHQGNLPWDVSDALAIALSYSLAHSQQLPRPH